MASTASDLSSNENRKIDIRKRLEASGKYAKMKAMIITEALKTIKQEGPAEEAFSVSERLKNVTGSASGKQAMSVILEFLEHLGLQYTASVLKLESGMESFENSLSLAKSLKITPSKDSCLLLSLLESGGAKEVKTSKAAPEPLAVKPPSAIESESEDSLSSSSTSVEGPEKPSEKPSSSEDGVPTGKDSEDSTYCVSKWKGKTVTRINQVAGQQVQLEYLEECKVRILDPLDSATVDDCEGGELIIAACEGSVFLRNCKKMRVHVACKQLRLRDCAELDLRIFTTTDPVVEMSHGITFRPFHLRLPKLDSSFTAAKLSPDTNRFVHVYDFTEDAENLPKPHFSVLYPDHRVAMEDRCAEHGTPICPKEIEDLLNGRLQPAASSETGENKSYNIKTGAALWNAPSPAQAPAAPPLKPLSSTEKKPPLAPPLPVPKAPIAAAPTKEGEDDEYSEFDDDSNSSTEDSISVDEDDDEF